MSKKILFLTVLFAFFRISFVYSLEIIPLKKPLQSNDDKEKKLLIETTRPLPKPLKENVSEKIQEKKPKKAKKIEFILLKKKPLIPGKKTPKIINEKMINNMQQGSVIYDLAASQGGNAAYTEIDKIVEKNGVTIVGESTILNKLPTSASNLYAKNIFNFVLNLYDKDNKKININMEDEIINKTLVK